MRPGRQRLMSLPWPANIHRKRHESTTAPEHPESVLTGEGHFYSHTSYSFLKYYFEVK
jgi:hypothetical protein